jgi:FkbM family methyltransferase
MVGAHDGSKTQDLVNTCNKYGPCVLIEAVPWIFAKLERLHSHRPQVVCINEVISTIDGEVDFFSLPEEARLTNLAADQMGSLLSTHATDHEPKLKSLLTKQTYPSRSFSKLFEDLGVSELDLLMTDMEGVDVETLITFPFSILRPYQIVFEAKHADGCMALGKKMATLLLLFDALNYRVSMIGSENFIAVDTLADQSKARVKIHI